MKIRKQLEDALDKVQAVDEETQGKIVGGASTTVGGKAGSAVRPKLNAKSVPAMATMGTIGPIGKA